MTKDEALKLGIESLEWHNQHMHRRISEQAIAAMKEALAQPEQESVEMLDHKAIGKQAYESGYSTGYMDCAVKMQAKKEQEPVAYIRVSKTGNVMACAKTGDFYKLPDKTLLYTAPPPCPTCEALARTVMMDQTGRDA